MKKYIYTILFFIFIGNSKAQDYLSFYNLKDYVIQVQDLSPVFLPKYKVSFGTPVNLGANINSNYKIGDIFEESGGGLKIDLDNLNALAADKNNLNFNATFNHFMLGIKLKKGSLTFFANRKANINWEFSDDFIGVAANGLGSSFSFSRDRMRITGYSEIGVGLTRQFLKEKLALAVRVKYLNGLAHGEIQDNASFSVDINESNFNWLISSSNATVNTSFSRDVNEFSLFSGNNGIGIDLGLNYKISEKLSFDLAVNDLGAINWKNDVKNYNITDNDNTLYEGVDFESSGDVLEDIERELGDLIGTNETEESFTTQLGTKLFASLKYQLAKRHAFRAVYFKDNNSYIKTKPSYALGYNLTLKRTSYGITAGKGGLSEDFRFGGNFAIQLGFLQLYGAVDDFSNFGKKIEEINSSNFRFGINFLFGYKKNSSKEI